MLTLLAIGEVTGQGWAQIGELAIAFALSALIGFERELKQKSAGLRTYTVVGFGAALFMLVSKYGFSDVLGMENISFDPSRVAAQIVSGLGFIGGGIIFVKRDSVRGLTTAASIWLTAAVGAAAGAGLVVLAVFATGAYFFAILALSPVARVAVRHVRTPRPVLTVSYLDGRGLLRQVLSVVTEAGFLIADLVTTRQSTAAAAGSQSDGANESLPEMPSVVVRMRLEGHGDLHAVLTALSELEGVLAVGTEQEEEEDEPY